MDKVFEIYIPGENASAWVSGFCLPATPWEMWDTMEQLGVDRLECLGFEVEKYHRGAFLGDVLNHSITVPQLNILAWKLAEIDAVQETALEGLVKMEQRKQGDAPLTFPTLLKLAKNTSCCQVVRAANVRPFTLPFYSFSFETAKDTAGCRTLCCNYIVGGM